jgi:hypothetical protein
MTTRRNRKDGRDLDRETERYRQAAIHALEQLDWCIEYLYKIRKAELARALARNRSLIVERARIVR